jgi:RHS repeat-associated protein
MELNGSTVEKAYIYANGQIIAQHTGKYDRPIYFYLHDRLGSVRQIINYESSQVNVVDRYTYTPFGETYPSETQQDATLKNRFMFTGQYYDDEIKQYYLRARQYDPYLARFTARDPVRGKFQEPLTLHRYLYCLNDPINQFDPTGKWTMNEISGTMGFKAFVLGAILGGVRNALLEKPIWKGALAGGLAAGTPAFLGVHGVVAAMASGGINAGVSAGLDGRSIERVLAETGAGIAMGATMYGITSWSMDMWMDARMIPASIERDFHRLFDPVMGSAGGDVVNAFSTLVGGEDEEQEN